MGYKHAIVIVLLSTGIVGAYVTNEYFHAARTPSDSHPGANTATSIEEFISRFNFPTLRKAGIILSVPEQNLNVFKVVYGGPHDCIAGCFYSTAFGMKHNDKIAWISINNYDSFNTTGMEMYDFDETDQYLFTEEFFERLKSADCWVFQYPFLNLLSDDPDVPEDTLLLIAEEGKRGC